jgi:hypothetical protein
VAVFFRLDVFFRILIEILLASGGAEIIHLALVFRFVDSHLGVNIHTTNGIFNHLIFLPWANKIAQLYAFSCKQPRGDWRNEKYAFRRVYYLTLPFSLALSAVPIFIAAVFLLVWYILCGIKLLRLASGRLKENP